MMTVDPNCSIKSCGMSYKRTVVAISALLATEVTAADCWHRGGISPRLNGESGLISGLVE